ncbi:MAG: ParB N-terminal domain-containing protein [Roseobacter sp.]
MVGKNKFGFEPLAPSAAPRSRDRSPGPMGAAVRDAAESMTEATEAKVEQRRRNAEDAKTFRQAQEDGRVLLGLAIADIATDDLPRDRLALEEVARSDEMEELKASIRARGQKEPVEVYQDAAGRYQIKKGWRRLTALRQLLDETGDARFAEVIARVETGSVDRLDRYVDMVEENVVREDLTFAEMAQVAITAAADAEVEGQDAEVLVNRLYGSLHKMKRSYIRSFVVLLEALGDSLPFPKAVSRNLGVEVVRVLKAGQGDLIKLRGELSVAQSPEDQERLLQGFVSAKVVASPAMKRTGKKEKFEFRVGESKVTARRGECRIVSGKDFTSVPRDRLERAILAFEAALEEEGNPRVTTL